jgi:hypothetical protein
MQAEDRNSRQNEANTIFLKLGGGRPPGPFAKALGAVVAVLLFGAALMFSLFFVLAAVVFGLAAWGWLWWKTRRVRREFEAFNRQAMHRAGGDWSTQSGTESAGASETGARQRPSSASGVVIEGEVIAVESGRDGEVPPR